MNNQTSYAISVLGLGYVGCISAACLAQMGHQVIGVDINPHKVELINQGKPTIIEKDITELVREQHQSGRLSATTDIYQAVGKTDICIICVGTPSDHNGYPNLSYIWHVAEQIREAVKEKTQFQTIIIRSTVPPGTCRQFEAIIAQSGKLVDQDFTVISNPEFLREGSSIADYYNPPYTLLGTRHIDALHMMRQLYGHINAPIIETGREEAEMIKYVNNSFHALKVVFANEVGAICRSLGVNSHLLMNLFCQDHHLNISSAYLMPGFAYGGSCLPKDVKALHALARSQDVEVSVLAAIERSNEQQIKRALDMIISVGRVRVGVLGLAFKSGTDDLRESPIVKLLELLIGKGYEVIIYDQHVWASKLLGANKQYIDATVPHLAKLLASDLNDVKEFAELIVVAQKNEENLAFVTEILASKVVIDLVHLFPHPIPEALNYQGLQS